MIMRQQYPQQSITLFKAGDRVVTQAGTPFETRGVLVEAQNLDEKLQAAWREQTGGDAIIQGYLVMVNDEPDSMGLLLSFPWDRILTAGTPRVVERKQVFYVAHPVSGDIDANVDNAIEWINWLTINDPSRVYIAPWIPEVLAFRNDPLVVQDNQARKDFYDRVLADDQEVVSRLDGILLVGGRISEGMSRELAAAEEHSLWVQDWSHARTPADLTASEVLAMGCQ